MRDDITKELLIKYLEYREGTLYLKPREGEPSKVNSFNKQHAGRAVGTLHTGYLRFELNVPEVPKFRIYNHVAIFIMHYGYRPKVIDHKDGDKLNNKIENLREATVSENICNLKTTRVGSSGERNIRANKSGSYTVLVTKNGKSYNKTLPNLEDAIEYRNTLLKQLHSEFSYFNRGQSEQIN